MAKKNAELKGFELEKNSKIKPVVLVGVMEHSSVVNPAIALANEGFQIKAVPVDKNGFYDYSVYQDKITDQVVLVSLQSANTEIGTIQNLEPFVKEAHKIGALFHSDCVGTFGHIDYNFVDINVDAATVSGHKLGSPKGIGALYLKAKTPCRPLIYGGEQESGWRSGTQSVALAASMSKAVDFAFDNLQSDIDKFISFKEYVYEQISKIHGVRATVDDPINQNKYLPNIIHLLFKNKDRKDIVKYYSDNLICVSGGTACSMNSDKPCRIMKALNIAEDEIYGSMRISFSHKTTFEEIEKFISVTKTYLS